MADKAAAFLRSKQDHETGGWSVNPKGPVFPAITGLVLSGLMGDPTVTEADPAVGQAVKFMLNYQQDDGGVYDTLLPTYNTSICVVALSKVSTPQAKAAVAKAREFLKTLQYGDNAVSRPAIGEMVEKVGKDHPFHGGFGYGRQGRPDLSNTGWALEALHASGVESDSAEFQRAIVFLQRLQMVDRRDGVKINDMEFARGSRQGGFIYATGTSKDKASDGQSFAGTIKETLSDGTTASRLRAYGSMTYSGFKSYIYANLPRSDPRVAAAWEWIGKNYTLAENPGVGQDGFYYYIVVFAKAMRAYGDAAVPVVSADGAVEHKRWASDLVKRLGELQEEDGGFRSVDDRWMENDRVLITAYALIALREAGR